jgi:hypothetical protein
MCRFTDLKVRSDALDELLCARHRHADLKHGVSFQAEMGGDGEMLRDRAGFIEQIGFERTRSRETQLSLEEKLIEEPLSKRVTSSVKSPGVRRVECDGRRRSTNAESDGEWKWQVIRFRDTR